MRVSVLLTFLLVLVSCKVPNIENSNDEFISSSASRTSSDEMETGFSNPEDPDEIWIPNADEYEYLEGITVADTFDHNSKPIYKCAVGGMAMQLGEHIYQTLDMQSFKLQKECAFNLRARVYGFYWNPPWPTIGQEVFTVKSIEYLDLETIRGHFISMMAIGGETTGQGIRLVSGKIFEVKLLNNIKFKEGKSVDLIGHFKQIFSTTRGEYQLFVVSSME